MTASEEELYIRKIKEGTVIDHITSGHALSVMRILGLTGKENNVVSIAINVPSRQLGRKDIVKVEDKELSADELDKIALIAPKATINIIRNFVVVEKQNVRLPKIIRGIVQCDNPMCISNSREPIQTTFFLEVEDPLRLRCYYCNRIIDEEAMIRQF